MAYRRRRKSRGTRGKKCVRRRRVHVRGQGMALRCVKYSSRRGRSRRRKSSYRRHRKPRGMARRGSRCLGYKRVKVRGQGYARRCRRYSRR